MHFILIANCAFHVHSLKGTGGCEMLDCFPQNNPIFCFIELVNTSYKSILQTGVPKPKFRELNINTRICYGEVLKAYYISHFLCNCRFWTIWYAGNCRSESICTLRSAKMMFGQAPSLAFSYTSRHTATVRCLKSLSDLFCNGNWLSAAWYEQLQARAYKMVWVRRAKVTNMMQVGVSRTRNLPSGS